MAPIAPISPAAIPALAPADAGTTTAGMLQLAQGLGLGASGAAQSAPLASFQEFFADAVKKTADLDAAAQDQQKQLLVGNTDNIHDVMIAMEKADVAMQLTMAVRNKVIDAYTEVMRMSI
jgi:flagellar hook-basal body complex protein FliE